MGPTARVERRRTRRWGSFPTTADVGLWASGASPSELFEALALGLYALMTDLRGVRPAEARNVSASGSDLPALIVAFLGELLVLEESDGFVGSRVSARALGSPPTAVLATVRGERFDPTRHARRKEVKAVTYHRLEAGLDPPRARVIVDI